MHFKQDEILMCGKLILVITTYVGHSSSWLILSLVCNAYIPSIRWWISVYVILAQKLLVNCNANTVHTLYMHTYVHRYIFCVWPYACSFGFYLCIHCKCRLTIDQWVYVIKCNCNLLLGVDTRASHSPSGQHSNGHWSFSGCRHFTVDVRYVATWW